MNGPGGGGAPGGGAGGGGGAGTGAGAGGAGAGAAGGCAAGRAVRRSRSQGTRKLHKCLSTASDVYAAPPAPQHSLLTTRQYCSFGSTVTLYEVILSLVSFHSETVAISSPVLFSLIFGLFSTTYRSIAVGEASLGRLRERVRGSCVSGAFELSSTDLTLCLTFNIIVAAVLSTGHCYNVVL